MAGERLLKRFRSAGQGLAARGTGSALASEPLFDERTHEGAAAAGKRHQCLDEGPAPVRPLLARSRGATVEDVGDCADAERSDLERARDAGVERLDAAAAVEAAAGGEHHQLDEEPGQEGELLGVLLLLGPKGEDGDDERSDLHPARLERADLDVAAETGRRREGQVDEEPPRRAATRAGGKREHRGHSGHDERREMGRFDD